MGNWLWVKPVREHALKLHLELLQVLAVGLAFGRLKHWAPHLVNAPETLCAGPESHGPGRQESGALHLVDRDRGASARSGFPIVRSLGFIFSRGIVRGKLFLSGFILGKIAGFAGRYNPSVSFADSVSPAGSVRPRL